LQEKYRATLELLIGIEIGIQRQVIEQSAAIIKMGNSIVSLILVTLSTAFRYAVKSAYFEGKVTATGIRQVP